MKAVVVCALLAVLAGCSKDDETAGQGKSSPVVAATAAPTSVDYYLAHEDEMRAKLKASNSMSAQERQGDAACETAALAQHRAMGEAKWPKLLPDADSEKEKAQTNPGQ